MLFCREMDSINYTPCFSLAGFVLLTVKVLPKKGYQQIISCIGLTFVSSTTLVHFFVRFKHLALFSKTL